MAYHFSSDVRVLAESEFQGGAGYFVGAVGAAVVYDEDFAESVE